MQEILMREFYSCYTQHDGIKITPDLRNIGPIVWNRDGEYCVIPLEIVQNAINNFLMYEKLDTKKITIPCVTIHWNQGFPINNLAGRALLGE